MHTFMKWTYCSLFCMLVVSFVSLLMWILNSSSNRVVEQDEEFERRYQTKTGSLSIIVIVYNRHESLLRLLNSLNHAEYYSDEVTVNVWIDRSINGSLDQLTFQTAKSFRFLHGTYSVHVHSEHVGIFGQWLDTWRPADARTNTTEIAVILEDDLTVSPYFYKYLKLVHAMYDSRGDINGFSLQGLSIKHHQADTSLIVPPKESIVYLYPVIGTWGFSPNRRNWIQFINWYKTAAKNRSFKPLIPDNIVTTWYKQLTKKGRADTMWSIWHIYHAWKHNELTLYPNFGGHLGLSTNWRESGLHYGGKEKGASNPLVTKWEVKYEHLPFDPIHLDIDGTVTRIEH